MSLCFAHFQLIRANLTISWYIWLLKYEHRKRMYSFIACENKGYSRVEDKKSTKNWRIFSENYEHFNSSARSFVILSFQTNSTNSSWNNSTTIAFRCVSIPILRPSRASPGEEIDRERDSWVPKLPRPMADTSRQGEPRVWPEGVSPGVAGEIIRTWPFPFDGQCPRLVACTLRRKFYICSGSRVSNQ